MSPKRLPDFAEYVWDAASRVGRSAPRIVDAILIDVFPATSDAAETEGATRMLRNGCISEVKRVLRNPQDDFDQYDFEDIDPAFVPLVKQLQRPSYYMPERDEEVTVQELIASPALLDRARRFMRKKGLECLAEAACLDRLFEAVTANMPQPRAEASILNADGVIDLNEVDA